MTPPSRPGNIPQRAGPCQVKNRPKLAGRNGQVTIEVCSQPLATSTLVWFLAVLAVRSRRSVEEGVLYEESEE